MGGHGHDGAAAVAGQDVVGDEDGHRLAGCGVGGEGAGEHRRLGPLRLALPVAQRGRPPPVGVDGLRRRRGRPRPGRGRALPGPRRAGRPARGRQLVHERVLGGQHQAGRAEQRVRPGGVDHDLGGGAGGGRGGEADVGALAAADPVPLDRLERVGPFEGVQVLEQPVRVGGDAQHPLAQPAAVDGVVPDLRAALDGHLLVGQDRPQPRAPVDRRLVEVGEAVGVDHPPPLDRVELAPRLAVGVRRRVRRADALLELLDQGLDGPRGPPVGVEPGPEQLQEDPLGPPVVPRVGGGERTTGVVGQPEPPELPPHGVDVLGGARPPGACRSRWRTARRAGRRRRTRRDGGRCRPACAGTGRSCRRRCSRADARHGGRRPRGRGTCRARSTGRGPSRPAEPSASAPEGLGTSNVPRSAHSSCHRDSMSPASSAV